ncbi:hypothetical protein ECG_07027 [Echinococcus granulosus]|nr:hypothetical protein ECG_07027 [Echinococcus granulosus]
MIQRKYIDAGPSSVIGLHPVGLDFGQISSIFKMGDNENINSLLERLVGVRKAGRGRVVELTKQRQEMVKAQLAITRCGQGCPTFPGTSKFFYATPNFIERYAFEYRGNENPSRCVATHWFLSFSTDSIQLHLQ